MGTNHPRKGVFGTGFGRAHLISISLALFGGLAFQLDITVADYVAHHHWPERNDFFFFVKKLCALAEVFAHGYGITFVLVGMYILDKCNRRALLRIAACAFLSGLSATCLKLLVARTRPIEFLPAFRKGEMVETFGDWLPIVTQGSTTTAIQSFPSGHTATAVGLAIGLSWLYPHARWYFLVIAILAGMQRLFTEAHYVSDALFGAAVGSAIAFLCTGSGYLGRFFDRFERSDVEMSE